MAYFLIRYYPTRIDFPSALTDEESAALTAHFNYLQSLRTSGQLFLAGPLTNASLGIAIIDATHQEQADHLLNNDPMVMAGFFSATIDSWKLAIHHPFPA